ncbi:hypothetical protein B6I94_26390 [Klebsiella pneumoniae]|nr:hypothetical protein BB746_27545 [Klebsiella pneumoniae]KAE8563200.1 hypothetical protein CA751_22695 [Klebsiella pneumoniae subsp. pneumoniae]ATQ27246.1 hypothetical protein CS526_29545 [Klebsiella pneumoniae]ATR28853.1 hypothetical protein CTI59_29560 [Klebsiella pneumoniae]ATR34420.1 hypothetical protein CTI61_29580 [Klebsiella pneumoniae]
MSSSLNQEAELSHEIVIIMEESERNVQMRENQENKKSRQIGVSLDIGNFCTLSALFNQY